MQPVQANRLEQRIAELEAENVRQRELAGALLRANLAITSAHELQDVLFTLLDCVNQLVRPTSATVMLVHGDTVRVRAQRGFDALYLTQDALELEFSVIGKPHLEQIVHQRQSALIRDTHNEPGWVQVPGSNHIRSWLGTPLIVRDQVVGVYGIDSDTPNYFDASHVELVEALAASAAVALDTSRLLHELRQARDAATEANTSKSAFIADVSHELRTPLNAIIGYAELVKEQAEEHGLREMVEDTQNIGKAARHLVQLIGTLLDLSKMEAGRLTLVREEVLLADLFEEVLVTVAPLANEARNAVDFEIADPELTVQGDPTRIKQVLLNLLGNACKFCRDGRIGLNVTAADDAVHIAVSDTGIGMNEDQVKHVFEPFKQADPTIHGRFGGTGLGLAVAHKLCELMGGSIQVRSQIGLGTTFSMVLPLEMAAI